MGGHNGSLVFSLSEQLLSMVLPAGTGRGSGWDGGSPALLRAVLGGVREGRMGRLPPLSLWLGSKLHKVTLWARRPVWE